MSGSGEMAHAMDASGFLLPRDAHEAQPVAVRGEGVWLYDRDGRGYIDACGGALVVTLGHGRREVAEAAVRQGSALAFAHTSEFLNEPAIELAARLATLIPNVGKVFFASSGSEVVEAAMKLARQYHVERGEPERRPSRCASRLSRHRPLHRRRQEHSSPRPTCGQAKSRILPTSWATSRE